jgi:MFS family permease
MATEKLLTKEYVIATLVNFLVAMNYYLLMIIISEYAMGEFGATESMAGFSASIFVIGALIARLFVGRYIAGVGYKEMLLIGALGGAVFTFAYFMVNGLPMLLIVRFLHGVSFGMVSTASATIIAVIIPKNRRGEGIGYYSLSQTLATAIGPFLGMLLSDSGTYTATFIVCAVAAVLIIAVAPLMHLKNAETPSAEKSGGFKISGFIEPGVVSISIVALLIYVCYSGIVSFLSVYAKNINLETAAGFFFVVYAAAVLVSRPPVAIIFDRRGEHIIMYPAIAIYGAGLVLLSQSRTDVVLLLAAACVGLGLGAIQSSTQAIAVKVTPQHRVGIANSTYFMLCDIGMGIGPILVGVLIPLVGYRGMYAVAALIAFACLIFYFLLHHRKSGKGKD